jgi:hypothetical protein
MISEFEYRIEWLDEEGFVYAGETYVTQVEGDSELAEDSARLNAMLFAEAEEPDFDYKITLIDAR